MGDPGDDPGDYGVDEAPAIFPTPAAGHFDVSGIAETWKRPAEVVFPRTLNPFARLRASIERPRGFERLERLERLKPLEPAGLMWWWAS